MRRQFILDKEIVLNEQTDLLNTAGYAKNITKIIQNAPQGRVFTIGLFGSWGSGKSSIIETVRENLTKNRKSKVKFISYDAWKYVNDSFRRMFLFEVQRGLGHQRTSLMDKFYQNSSQDIDVKNKISPLKIFSLIAALIITIILVQFSVQEIDTKVSIYSIIALVGVLGGILTGAFNQLKVSVQRPHIFAPEQFYSCNLYRQGLRYITDGISSYLLKNERSAGIWDSYFHECIRQYNDASVIKPLGVLFTKVYKQDHFSLTELNQAQIDYLVNDDLLSYAIEQWPDLDNDNIYIKDVVYISQKRQISENVVIKIYEKIHHILGDLRGVSQSIILEKLKAINIVTENLSLTNNLPSIQNIVTLIAGTRPMPHPSYPSHRNYDQNIRFIDECTNDDTAIETVVKFGCITYKVSSGRIAIDNIIDPFFAQSSNIILDQLLWLKNRWGFNLYPLANYILKFKSYNNDKLMELFADHFTAKPNNRYILSEEIIQTKLDEMLKFAIQHNSSQMFDWLNAISLKSERIKAMLIPIISEKTIADIQTLPKDLMNLAVNSINKTNIENYKKYPDFLTYLAQNGNMQQKSYLAGMFSDMLNKNENVNVVLGIIQSFNSLKQVDCKLLTTQIQRIMEGLDSLPDDNEYLTAMSYLNSLLQPLTRAKEDKKTA